LTALTGRGPVSSSTSAAGCQYIRINFPHASLGPVRVIRSFCSRLIMAAGPFIEQVTQAEFGLESSY
jgi:hypothetical protein